MRPRLLFVLMLTIAWASATPPKAAVAQVINFKTDDAQMNAAITRARASLPRFWQMLANPDRSVSKLLLKVAIPVGDGGHEHIWLVDIRRKGSRITGVIDNEPVRATHLRKGETYVFEEGDISDWMFWRNGKIVGSETLRVMMTRMSPEDAKAWRERFEDP